MPMAHEPERSPGDAVARGVRDALCRRAPVEDQQFDVLYPDHIRRLSAVHWTPVSVALRAAALLAPEPGMQIADLGAGPGKLCCIGALARGGSWLGVEHNPRLVAAAEGLAAQLGAAARFVAADMMELDWDRFDSLYLYNPFEADLFGAGRPDHAGWTAFAGQVARAEERLSALSTGTRVVTYHGFGGELPSSFALAFSEAIDHGELALWIRQPRSRRA